MEISLALGGGGIKGIAHIGVIRCLEQAGFRIRAISGTSAGALVGALYASGLSASDIECLVKRMDQSNLFGRKHQDGPALLGFAGLTQILSEVLGNRTFETLNIPFSCVAVDIKTAREMVLSKGLVMHAVIASASVPGVFPPQTMGDAQLIDGGTMDPVPVAHARRLAPHLPVVAVVLNPPAEEWADLPVLQIPRSSPIPAPIIDQMARLRIAQAFQIFVQSVDISSRMLTELRLAVDRPEIIIRPDVNRFGILDQVNPDELIQAGEAVVRDMIPSIKRVASWQSQLARRFRRWSPPEETTTIEN